MTGPLKLFRLLRISRILIKHNLDDFATTLHLFRPYRYLAYLRPWRWRRTTQSPRALRVREALEELGPIFVKFGQMLSTRPDLLPEDIAQELSKLQDQVPPFPGSTAISVIEAAYDEPLASHFAEFETEPVASASVAQVHRARLLDGTDVVAKVLRPNIEQTIERDLSLLYTLASLAERYWDQGPRLRPVEVIDEFNKTLHDELDLRREAANASQLRSNFKGDETIYIPEVYWDHTRKNVMVMEFIAGIPIRDVAALKAAGINMRKLAHDGVEIFFTQAFRDGFFHADMHPGNIFVSPSGQYRAVDFGIMGTLGEGDKRYLAENLLAFFNRDYHAVAEAHLRAGWVPPHTRIEEFEAAVRTVCEPIFAKPLSEISFGRLVLQLFQTARRFEMPIQPQLVLLQKTLLNIEGLGRQLYPELDLWETAKPYLERWMSEQVGPRALRAGLKRELPKWGGILPEVPALAHGLLRKLHDETATGAYQAREIAQLRRALVAGQRRQFVATVAAALILSAALLAALDGYAPQVAYGAPLSTWLLGALGVVLLVLAWPSGRR
ncbi:MAG: ubiquinone biosynthesis regulatory protein kinase UbiB [Gammaproteobacteria bacterium]|nr:ubiquinone biosynthesis regulatory protein kinase UbiB [Gammaproteobacteria bacterium]